MNTNPNNLPVLDSLPTGYRWTEPCEPPTVMVRVGTQGHLEPAVFEPRPMVYVLEWHLAYEGSGVVSVHATPEAAQTALEAKQAEGDRYYTYTVTPHVLIGA